LEIFRRGWSLYWYRNQKGLILLCHRSHSNRGEYRKTAPKFNKMGYSCLAIDQRSGMKVFGNVNETKNRAKEKGIPTGYLDAKPDIESAVEYAYALNNKNRIILLGSSYSASLALLISAKTDRIKSVLAFSPGEYLKGVDLADEIKLINIPVFITSSKNEINQVSDLIKKMDPDLIDHFKPNAEGFHGSKALWESVKGFETYWNALEQFLETYNAVSGRG
jgi:pimeloyl-ACP methyl ester carboxylesterase